MSLGRNHTRRKLSSIPDWRFRHLCLHICFEIFRRCSWMRIPTKSTSHPKPPMRSVSAQQNPIMTNQAMFFDNHDRKTPLQRRDSLKGQLRCLLDNLPDEYPSSFLDNLDGYVFPENPHDYYDATISAIYAVVISILRDEDRYTALLGYRGDAAQQVLDLLQMLLDYPGVSSAVKSSLLSALSRLSGRSGLYPSCFILKGIDRERNSVTSGHFGEIWRGRFREQTVCLKFIKMYQRSSRSHLLTAFSREAVLWGHISHPNLLPFYGIYYLGDEHGRMCLVSPWMNSGNINEYLVQVADAPRLLLVSDIAAGLEYLHGRDIVHGDLKGANILVTNSGRACISDFGLSTILDTAILHTMTSQSINSYGGTIRWQAPELFDPLTEDPRPTTASDIYAYACVCYEIFTSDVPYYEYHLDATVIFKVMSGDRPLRPSADSVSFEKYGLTVEIWDMMEECWSRVPEERPTIVEIVSRIPQRKLDSRPLDTWEASSASKFRNAMYKRNVLSMNVLETVLSWI
ncbi:kinase-like domain-containing protein [Crassisporium funariophilum]|nr:kinase-like domain-containing protein [Crassisporium funariophilum]